MKHQIFKNKNVLTQQNIHKKMHTHDIDRPTIAGSHLNEKHKN